MAIRKASEIKGEETSAKIKSHAGVEYARDEHSTPIDAPSLMNPDDTARVKVEVGFTKNLGNFESVKYVVGVELPCSTKEVDEVLERKRDYLDEKISKFLSEVG